MYSLGQYMHILHDECLRTILSTFDLILENQWSLVKFLLIFSSLNTYFLFSVNAWLSVWNILIRNSLAYSKLTQDKLSWKPMQLYFNQFMLVKLEWVQEPVFYYTAIVFLNELFYVFLNELFYDLQLKSWLGLGTPLKVYLIFQHPPCNDQMKTLEVQFNGCTYNDSFLNLQLKIFL